MNIEDLPWHGASLHCDAGKKEDEVDPGGADGRVWPVDHKHAAVCYQHVVGTEIGMHQRLSLRTDCPACLQIRKLVEMLARPRIEPESAFLACRHSRRQASPTAEGVIVRFRHARQPDGRRGKADRHLTDGGEDQVQLILEPGHRGVPTVDVLKTEDDPLAIVKNEQESWRRHRCRECRRNLRFRRCMAGESGFGSEQTALTKQRRPSCNRSLAATPGENPPRWVTASTTRDASCASIASRTATGSADHSRRRLLAGAKLGGV